MYALKQGRIGVREVQRSLGLSNASLAQYHINKLAEMGLLQEDGGEYQVVGEVKVDVLKDFTRLGRILIPRFVFYGVFFTVFAVYLGLVAAGSYASEPIIGLLPSCWGWPRSSSGTRRSGRGGLYSSA